jgi:hypothetical protein
MPPSHSICYFSYFFGLYSLTFFFLREMVMNFIIKGFMLKTKIAIKYQKRKVQWLSK